MAEKPASALDYLANPAKYPAKPVCAVFGDETFLRRQTILRCGRPCSGARTPIFR